VVVVAPAALALVSRRRARPRTRRHPLKAIFSAYRVDSLRLSELSHAAITEIIVSQTGDDATRNLRAYSMKNLRLFKLTEIVRGSTSS